MGRYFLFRMHPWSVGACASQEVPESVVQAPKPISVADWEALLEHGGVPEPFLKRDQRFRAAGEHYARTSGPAWTR